MFSLYFSICLIDPIWIPYRARRVGSPQQGCLHRTLENLGLGSMWPCQQRAGRSLGRHMASALATGDLSQPTGGCRCHHPHYWGCWQADASIAAFIHWRKPTLRRRQTKVLSGSLRNWSWHVFVACWSDVVRLLDFTSCFDASVNVEETYQRVVGELECWRDGLWTCGLCDVLL